MKYPKTRQYKNCIHLYSRIIFDLNPFDICDNISTVDFFRVSGKYLFKKANIFQQKKANNINAATPIKLKRYGNVIATSKLNIHENSDAKVIAAEREENSNSSEVMKNGIEPSAIW